MIQTREINYWHEDIEFCAYFAAPSHRAKSLPAVLIAPDWQGRNQAACQKAEELAALGVTAMALDLYGGAKLGRNKDENRALMMPLRQDRKKLISRLQSALKTVAMQPEVDAERMAIIGYCFGGLCALDLARSGANLRAAVSFHGLLDAPSVFEKEVILAKLLILHGYDDPLVLPPALDVFAKEMTARGADWQIHSYGHTAHSFTNPKANDASMGLHYHPLAAARSWRACLNLLNAVFSA